MSAIVDRNAARVVLIDDADRVLLFCAEGDDGNAYWFTPGGGLHKGESWEDAARRELREETGVIAEDLGPVVWHREHLFTWRGVTLRQRERFYVVRVPTTVVDQSGWDAEEVSALIAHRWWDLDDLIASGVEHSPRRLVELVRPLLRGEYPVEPVDAGH